MAHDPSTPSAEVTLLGLLLPARHIREADAGCLQVNAFVAGLSNCGLLGQRGGGLGRIAGQHVKQGAAEVSVKVDIDELPGGGFLAGNRRLDISQDINLRARAVDLEGELQSGLDCNEISGQHGFARAARIQLGSSVAENRDVKNIVVVKAEALFSIMQ
jgi:hypothetical protein